jgi:hypothetical protein
MFVTVYLINGVNRSLNFSATDLFKTNHILLIIRNLGLIALKITKRNFAEQHIYLGENIFGRKNGHLTIYRFLRAIWRSTLICRIELMKVSFHGSK